MKVVWKHIKWIAVAVAVGLGVVAIFLLRGLFVKEKPDGSKEDPLPEVEEKLKQKVRKAEEEALVSRVEAKVEAEKDQQELKEVAQIEDGKERRKRLAEMLRRL